MAYKKGTLPETMGWTKLNGNLVPNLMSPAPVPESCDEMAVAANRDVNKKGVAPGMQDFPAQGHANAEVLQTAAAKMMQMM